MAATKFLLVDVSKKSRDVLTDILERVGFDGELIREAENGKMALAIANTFGPDCIFWFNEMPVVDGVAFLREFRQENKATVVIIFSSEMTPPLRKEFLSLGANGVQEEIFSAADLNSRLADLRRILIANEMEVPIH